MQNADQVLMFPHKEFLIITGLSANSNRIHTRGHCFPLLTSKQPGVVITRSHPYKESIAGASPDGGHRISAIVFEASLRALRTNRFLWGNLRVKLSIPNQPAVLL